MYMYTVYYNLHLYRWIIIDKSYLYTIRIGAHSYYINREVLEGETKCYTNGVLLKQCSIVTVSVIILASHRRIIYPCLFVFSLLRSVLASFANAVQESS